MKKVKMVHKKQEPESNNERKLSQRDHARVDHFLKRGVNSVDRHPFRPVVLILLLISLVMGFSFLSQGIVHWAGVY